LRRCQHQRVDQLREQERKNTRTKEARADKTTKTKRVMGASESVPMAPWMSPDPNVVYPEDVVSKIQGLSSVCVCVCV
jgi:hypothetical protein